MITKRLLYFTLSLAFLIAGNILSHASAAANLVIPKPPVNLTAVAVSQVQITLTWQDASLDETGFELERSIDNKTFVKVIDLPVNTATYANIGLTASTPYWYRIRSKNASGFSAYSNIAPAVTKAPVITIPKAPTNLVAAVISGTQINLTWVDNAVDETGFELERSLDGVTFTKLTDLALNTISYQNTGLIPATRYLYRVLAKNAAGKSAYSNVVNATTRQVVPAAPEQLTASAISVSQINLTWLDKSANETGFQLERSINGTAFTKIADIAASVVTYQNTGLSPATQYFYRIRAVNAVGVSAYSNVASAKTLNIPVPNMPLDLTAVPIEPELIQLRWAPLTGNATEVIIERAKNSDETFVQIGKQAAAILQFEDKGKLETADYYYRIKASNAGGTSPYSLISIVRASSIITAVEPGRDGNLIFALEKKLVTELKNSPNAHLSIYDVRGILHKSIAINTSSRTDLNTLPSGIYIVLIQTDREVITRRILLY
ncbi:fibronectin type III domain-containing protein [Dyadobacter arcticus]|uniref:Titin n=1 Tax=Dyadobacter arcticus TaxID=1078754 RepID=A0ABX0UL57_9BACT|nr:fibronectin type III domain-containing protein [Dyadobacter arcticus]NIJ53734.1 titin [Dyadobacter arcticus]